MTGDAVAIECGFELVVSAFRRTFLRRLGDERIGVQVPGHGGQHPAREQPQSTAHRHGYRRPQSVTENRGKSTSWRTIAWWLSRYTFAYVRHSIGCSVRAIRTPLARARGAVALAPATPSASCAGRTRQA